MEATMNPEQMVLSEQIHLLIDQLGGKDDVNSVLPCATWLHIKLQKQPATNVEKLKQQIPSIKYFILLDRYTEVIMDQGLAPTYKELIRQIDHSVPKEKLNPIEKLLGLISEISTPITPLFAGSGILKGLVVLATTIGWLSETSGTYRILSTASNAAFYFLPISLVFSAARTFKVSGYIVVVIAAVLIEPNSTSLLSDSGKAATDFLGAPIVLM